jgi:hypothetical protein
MHARDGDIAATMPAQSIKKKLARPILVENTNSNAQDVYSLNFHLLAPSLSQGAFYR